MCVKKKLMKCVSYVLLLAILFVPMESFAYARQYVPVPEDELALLKEKVRYGGYGEKNLIPEGA